MNDEQLIEKIKKRPEVFGKIIDRYQKKLERYVLYLTGQKNEVDDLVQEVFIKVYINLNSFDTKKKFSSWIFRIAHNLAVNYLKKKKIVFNLNENINIDDSKNIEEDFEKKELKKIIESCLSNVPINYKEVVVLYYFENLSYEEISDSLKIPPGTVAIRLSRAKKYLKKLCQKQKI
jgi:RNA polymerase sigma-70 factor (ECF subfamily)